MNIDDCIGLSEQHIDQAIKILGKNKVKKTDKVSNLTQYTFFDSI